MILKHIDKLSAFAGSFSQNRRCAFTLAEALISLGVIAVVAAMTIPTLITYVALEKYHVQFKKAVSTLSNAGRMSQATFDIDYSATTHACDPDNADSENPKDTWTFCSIFNSVMKGRYIGKLEDLNYQINTVLYVPSEEEEEEENSALLFNTDPSNYLAYELPEGVMVAFPKNASGCLIDTAHGEHMGPDWLIANSHCIGFVDLNGTKTPNTIVNCDGVNSRHLTAFASCLPKSDVVHITDIYPIIYHDATVEPATAAAHGILTYKRRDVKYEETDVNRNHW